MIYWFLGKVVERMLEPYSSWEQFKSVALNIVYDVTDLRYKSAWLYLLLSLGAAYLVYWHGKRRGHFPRSKSFREVVFPADVYLHPSSIVDYKFVFFDQAFRGLIYAPVITGVSYLLYLALVRVLGTSSIHVSPKVALWVLPFYAILVIDFGYYAGHRLLHKVPFLWPFHEVHHSAEQLTPVTVFRVHPIEEMINGSLHAVLTALSAAFFTSMTDIKVDPYAILGLNVVTFLYYAVAFHLRHSHVWLSYGPVASLIVSSPAQHQCHHSEAERHWNKNFGLIFSFWDWMFGTIYVPKEREEIKFGCGADPADFSTLPRMYFLPFVKSYRALRHMVFPDRSAPQPESLPLASSAVVAGNSRAMAIDSGSDRRE